ncbi:uncharacterized protein [Clytia hemisphaerica]|uniref:uncharacterized protein n=1 Tax=Clytia hemisphaerica TaxID=252671 RepID=UPI0034D70346
MTKLLYMGIICVLMTPSKAEEEDIKFKTHLYLFDQDPYGKLANHLITRGTLLLCDQVIPKADESRITRIAHHTEMLNLIQEKNETKLLEMLNVSKTVTENDLIMVGPMTYTDMKHLNDNFYEVSKLIHTRPVLIVRKGEVLLLVKFLKSFQRCMTAVVFSLLCALIIATIVWIIETLAGSDHFPRSPGTGLWSSFWFTVVTMTTVGYGDKTPKHPLSRLIVIIWIIFGLMLVALITASAWNAIDEQYDTKGKSIAVIDRSIEDLIVRKNLLGTSVSVNEYDEIIDAVKSGTADAGLMEKHAAASFFADHEDEVKDLVIERELETDTSLKMFVHYNRTVLNCEDDEMAMSDEELEDEKETITKTIASPLLTNKYVIRPLHEIFDGLDKGLMIYTALIGVFVILLASIGELVYRYKYPLGDVRQEETIQREKYAELLKNIEQFIEDELEFRIRNGTKSTNFNSNNIRLAAS